MSHCHPSDKFGVIRNQKSGLVLDASEYVVKVQHFTGFPSQLWKLESAGPGIFYVVNKANGKVLDIQGGAGKGNNLITYGKNCGENQKWYVNSDDTIVSVAGNLAVDISDGKLSAGNVLIAFSKHGGDNQKFHFQHQ